MLGERRHFDKNVTAPSKLPNVKVADSIDWRTSGKVNPVKNQGQCGSCWTFATAAVLESHAAIQFGTLYSFAEQEIVDCDHEDDNEGCNGGLAKTALKWAINNQITTEDNYPYKAVDQICNK